MTLAASTSSEVPGATSSAARLASTTPRPPGGTGRQRHHHHQGVRRHADADTCCVAARDKDRVIGLLADQQRLLASTDLSLIHISEPTRLLSISYAVFCLKKKKQKKK